MARNRLITIPFSHYCEKARWALERCGVDFVEDGHLPLLHWSKTLRARAGRTVPALVTSAGEVLKDSTDILQWADRGRTSGAPPLYPEDPEARADVEALEDVFDNKLGPAARRVAYSHVFAKKRLAMDVVRSDRIPRWQDRTASLFYPLARTIIVRALRVDDDGIERSRARLESMFALVEERLADGRPYLAGDTFTAADLTFASLAAPMLLPPRYAEYLTPLERFTDAARVDIERCRERPAGAFGMRVYAEHRSAA